MKIKITEKVLCIPPYISTTWDKIAFLQSEENTETKLLTLILHLHDNHQIKIPNLDSSIVDIAFSAHLKYLENYLNPSKDQASRLTSLLNGVNPEQIIGLPIRFGEGLESALQHNPAQANMPDMPQEILNKITAITKILSNGDPTPFPKPEPHCNCFHCQVARVLHGINKDDTENSSEEPITEEDLKFKTWDILQCGDKLYTVTNPLDTKEQYSVYLGSPLGCTCGLANCEHIRAVLTS